MKEMNDILENGMLERYALGELNKSERAEVEDALLHNPELKKELELIEENLEQLAHENAVAPPSIIKKQLLRRIHQDEDVQVKPTRSLKPGGKLYFAVAATLAVLFLLSSFWLYQRMNGIQQELELVQKERQELQDSYEQNLEELSANSEWLSLLNDPDTSRLVMKGNELSPEATAISFVNHDEKTVVLQTAGLPELDDSKDYQLWADVEGEMIDMGVIPRDKELAMMTYIEDAESLNITIEPKGGNDHPTVSNLITAVRL